MEPESAQTRATDTKLAALVTPDPRDEDAQLAGRLRLSLSLFHDGVRMKRASLQRAFPAASPAEIEERLRAWLLDRPHDRPGVAAIWPRR